MCRSRYQVNRHPTWRRNTGHRGCSDRGGRRCRPRLRRLQLIHLPSFTVPCRAARKKKRHAGHAIVERKVSGSSRVMVDRAFRSINRSGLSAPVRYTFKPKFRIGIRVWSVRIRVRYSRILFHCLFFFFSSNECDISGNFEETSLRIRWRLPTKISSEARRFQKSYVSSNLRVEGEEELNS